VESRWSGLCPLVDVSSRFFDNFGSGHLARKIRKG